MFKLTINDYDHGSQRKYFGSMAELKAILEEQFPDDVQPGMTLGAMVAAVNGAGFSGAKVEEVKENNLLPDDYLTHDQGDDPERPR